MVIIVDAMGGDHAPHEIVKGCVDAVNIKEGFDILLVGDEKAIEHELSHLKYDKARISIQNATEKIENEDIPTKAIKGKKDSSMVVGFRTLKEGKGDAFMSAGNTGALLTGSLLLVGRIKGVSRPALAPVIPTKTGMALLIDAGSNAECTPENLLQFAVMGSIYMKNVYDIQTPRVGLVNIGSEEKKGSDMVKQAYALLSNNNEINFVGNIEGREIPEGMVDVVVCDGFVGNVILKLMEGMGKTIMDLLKEEFTKNAFTTLGAMILKPGLRNFKKRLDYKEYGGAPFLGINGIVVKSHGSSNARAIMNSVLVTKKFVESQVIGQIREDFIGMEVEDIDTSK